MPQESIQIAMNPPSASSLPLLKVFLCHSSGDKPAVRDLYKRLSASGVKPWLDEVDLVAGQDWELEIRKAVRNNDVVVVCLSQSSITKTGFVQKEIRFALDAADEHPEGQIYVIPLRLEACKVPDRLSKWQWVNLFEQGGYKKLIQALRIKATDQGVAIPLIREEYEKVLHDALVIDTPFHLELVRVPAGEFLMGGADSDKVASYDEKPQHKVTLDEYLIGKYDVTNEQFAVFAMATKRDWMMPAGKENYPVVSISWIDAVAFCKWASQVTGRNVQLPTEAQWEKAARGTDGRIYPWGNSWDAGKANTHENGPGDTTPVGKYSPAGDSPYGAADMTGNVWQWAADWYDEKCYANSPTSNPQNPASGTYRALRGGSWVSDRQFARCSYRSGERPRTRNFGLGFRVVVRLAPVP